MNLVRSVTACALTLAAGAALGDYPDRPIRLIISSAAGGSPDVVTRILAAELTKQMGQQIVIDNAGALPLSFEIEAQSLQEAARKFGDGAKVALQQTMERLEEMRREAASSIIVPEAGAAGQLGGLGGVPGGGKIRLP